MYKVCKTEQSARRQRQLEQGLLEMMQHSRYEDISVSDLCDYLEVPRKSFYRYFSSKDGALYALLDHTMMGFFETGIGASGTIPGTQIGDLERFFAFWRQPFGRLQTDVCGRLSRHCRGDRHCRCYDRFSPKAKEEKKKIKKDGLLCFTR